MENIEQMHERHCKEKEELQSQCKHKKLSEWQKEWWAIAHSTGRQIKVCLFCGKVIKSKGLELGKCKILK